MLPVSSREPLQKSPSVPQTVVIIPARFESSRLPGKPLADIDGEPRIVHVYRRALATTGVDAVIVATDDERVAKAVEACGGRAEMTSRAHRTGTERVAEVAARLASVDPAIAQGREASVAGARELWPDTDPLGALEANHGYASRLIGSPETILARIAEFRALGIEMLHLDLRDRLFQQEVLPHLQAL